jgi:CRP-like cAMP-binding protein
VGASNLLIPGLYPPGLTHHETELLDISYSRILTADPGHEFAALGTVLNRPKLVVSGWVGMSRLLDDGRRQLVDLQIAGELTALGVRPDSRAQVTYACLTQVRYVEFAHILEKVAAQPELYPDLTKKIRAAEEGQFIRLIDQTVRVGRLLAHERMAHLALDLYRRHDRAGFCMAQSFPMPLTQEVIGDVLGMSTVHVNRTLQQLRRDGLLKTAGGRWQIINMEEMQALASGTRQRHNGL